ncbi:MAG: fibronectin type III domain-containing protein, partial [Chloroflexi bacterium]|nr:fibronectin type III domain-containing protein [Chloroflexota bacterium]
MGTLTNPAFQTSTTARTYSFTHAGLDLDADTTYWLRVNGSSSLSGTNYISVTSSNAEDAGAAPGWSIADQTLENAIGRWRVLAQNAKLRFGIKGFATPAPSLVSNFGQTDGNAGSLSTDDHAQAFTTGSHARGYILAAIDLRLAQVSDAALGSKLRVTVNADSGGGPGAVVGTLTTPTITTSTTDQTYSFTHSGLPLGSNTTYWVVVDVHGSAPTGTNTIRNTNSDAEDAGAASGWSIANDKRYRTWNSTGAWNTSSTPSIKIDIRGLDAPPDAPPVPPPPDPALVGNLAQPKGTTISLVANRNDAQAFTTGRNPGGYTVTSVDIEFAQVDWDDLETAIVVTVNADSGGEPGAVVGTLTNPAFQTSTTARTYSFTHAGLELDGATTYWLVVGSVSTVQNTNRIRYTLSDSEDVSVDGWSVANTKLDRLGGGSWISRNYAMLVQIRGTRIPPLVSNFGQANGGTGSLVAHDHAQAFTTGSNVRGYDLTAIDLQFPAVGDGALASKLTVTVNEDSGGAPGAVVDTLTNPGTMTTGANSFTHAGLRLERGTTYWVVLDVTSAPSGTNTIRNTASDAEDAGAAPGFSIADDALWRNRGGGSWTTFGLSRKINIRGAVAAGGPPDRLVSNLGEAAATSVGLGNDFAQAFTTGPNAGGYEVTGVDLRFDTVAAGLGEHLVVHVRRDGGGSPGTRVGTLTEPAFTASAVPTKYTFTHSGLRLEPDTTYWVTVDQDASTVATGSRLSTTASDAENAGGAAGFSIANVASWKPDATFTWSSVRDLSGGRSLYVGVTGVPLPAEPGVPATLSNLEMPDGGAHNLTSDRAVSFTTGNNGDHHALESVEIEFAQVGDSAIGSKLEVAILGDSSGAPNWGDRLAMLTNPTFQTGSADRTYTFSYDGDDGAGLRLAPDTTYWVAAFNSNRDLSGTNSIRGTTSASERLQGLPVGWGIANDSREWSRSTSSWNTQAEPLKIGLNLGAADPFVQFRTCEGTVSGNSCSTGWVTANYTKYDPPPTIELMEGGAAVTYQWRAVDPRERRHHYVAGQVVEPRSHFGGYIGAGGPDRDRLICHTGMDTTRIGDPIVYVPPQAMVVGIGYGSTAGPLLDRHDGCPFAVQSIYEHDPNKWRPLSVAAGQDSDAFDHTTFLILEPYSVGHWFHNDEGEAEYAAGFGYPEARLPLIIRDDDEWENDIVISVDNGTTWTSIEDGGLDLAFPRSLNNGYGGQNYAHRFWVRLKNDPSTITGAPASKRFSVIAHAPPSPISSGTQAEFEAYYVCLRSPAADELHSFRAAPECTGGGSAEVSYTPIQVEIHVGVSVTGSIRFEVEGYHLYERWDTQISTETPKKRVRTKSFNFDRTLGSCVGCQLLPGELPDPVVERVGDLTYANLSDTGIDLSWPRVVGAEGYQVRYWSTTSPFPGVSPEEAWFGAEPSEPAWNIRHLEPETEYRAVVYYQDHGATQLSTASPVIRFTTLAAGAPVEAEPTSVIVERVPEVSITADAGRITEGEDATFTVTVEPAPDAPLDVKVHVVAPAAGDVVNRQHLGTRTVNVSTTGSATFTIPTVDDASWDANGMLGATVDFGDGYRRSAFGSFASVNIRNNDLPPPPAVQLKGISDTTMTVAWKPQGDGASYLVVWHKAYSGIPVLSEVTTTETEYEITGLEPNSHYTLSVLHGTNQLRTMTVRTLAAGATPKTFEVDFETPAPNTSVPVISVTSDGDVTEGADASFTVTANPAPDADLDVSVTVSAEGDYGAATGQRTVTIPTAGYVALTVATTGDDVDETNGSVTVTVDPDADHDDYLVSTTQGSATVVVSDDDASSPYHDYQTVVDLLIEVRDNPPNPAMRNNPAHVKKWNRVLAAVGYDSGESAMPASEIHDNAAQWPDSPFHAASVYLTSLEQPRGQGQQQTPEISVTGGAGITEGGDAVFTVTASPAPAANLDVSVTVSQSGDYGATTGQRTVTVSTSGIVSFAVGTADDSADEADGSVTATVDAGSDYTVS